MFEIQAASARVSRALLRALAIVLAGSSLPWAGPAGAHDLVDFESQVKPILQRSCGGTTCHISQMRSGVELTTWESLRASVGLQYKKNIVIAGNPLESPLFDKITNNRPQYGIRMPQEGDLLTSQEIALIRRWIFEGAEKSHKLTRGDANGDDVVDISDAILTIFYLFQGGPPPACTTLLDSDSDGVQSLTDAIFVLEFLFQSGPAPRELSQEESEACEHYGELSFTSLYQKVLGASCAFSSCHGSSMKRGGLSLATREEAHAALVGVLAENETAKAAGLLRVDAGRPDKSFLIRKLLEPGPGEGNRMPPNSSTGLTENTIQAFREWILAGAPLDGTISGVPDLRDEPLPPVDRIPAPSKPEHGVQLHLEPFAIGPGREREIFYFISKPLASLPEDPVIERIDIHMTEDSHHFILYEWSGSSQPPSGVRDIDGPADLLGNHRFMTGAQQSFFTMAFPPGVGLKVSRNASFDLNSHYLNLRNNQILYGEVYINIFFAQPGTITTFVKPIFENNIFINVPPNQTRTTKGFFPSDTAGRVPAGRHYHIYALSSHMHRHGKRFQVWVTNNRTPISPTPLHDNPDWDDPIYQLFDPPLVLDPGQGLLFETTHHYFDPPSANSPPLNFGLTSEDEMAILLGYYAVK